MYTIHDHGDMIADRGRTGAYAAALCAHVTAASVVVDIGAGAGILTLLACQAGARKVFAIESEATIAVAQDLVRANGFAERVTFIQDVSTAVTLPEKADIVVADIHGALPFYQAAPAALFDARNRLLKPGGVIIPVSDTVLAGVVSAPSTYRQILEPWEQLPGLDGTAGRLRSVNSWRPYRFPAKALVVEPAVWLTLAYSRAEPPTPRATVSWTIGQPCEAHGLCLWFDCDTAPGSGFSNSPRSGEDHVFGQAFLPWPEACRLESGDQVSADIRADLVSADYLWSWRTTIRRADAPNSVNAEYAQSEFRSVPFSRDWLRKSSSSFIPSPNEDAGIDKLVLLVDRTPLEDIARRVSERFPDRHPTWRDALTRVGQLSMRYSK